MNASDLWAYVQIGGAEIILALGVLYLLVWGAFRGDKGTSAVSTISVLLLVGAGAFTAGMSQHVRAVLFNGAVTFDLAAAYAKILIYGASAVAILLGDRWMRRNKMVHFEYPLLIVLAALGMSIMVSANTLLSLYIGVEMQSLALYVLAAFSRDDGKSSEAGLKYFVLGALSSGLLLYGASLIYGFSGSLTFVDIAAVAGASPSVGLTFGLVFVLAGLAFKVSAAPFHMWTPDVYEGAPTPVVAFFASAPKVAALVLIARVLAEAFTDATVAWSQILVVIATLSMAVGALGGLMQQNVKRLFAYSSIANMGYACVGLAAGGQAGVEATLVFVTFYVVTALGSFACLLALSKGGKPVEMTADFAGLSKSRPGIALALTTLLFSTAGIPPLAGFWGKFYVFKAAVNAGLVWLAITGVLLSVIGAFYYLRLIKVMWFDAPAKGVLDKTPWEAGLVAASAALFAAPVSWFVLPWLAPLVRAAAASLF